MYLLHLGERKKKRKKEELKCKQCLKYLCYVFSWKSSNICSLTQRNRGRVLSLLQTLQDAQIPARSPAQGDLTRLQHQCRSPPSAAQQESSGKALIQGKQWQNVSRASECSLSVFVKRCHLASQGVYLQRILDVFDVFPSFFFLVHKCTF